MKTLLATLVAFVLGASAATARTLEITIDNIRSDRGRILVMARIAGQEQPIYGMADAKKGSVRVTLTGLEADRAEVSLFHDEDSDFKMKMGDRGPQEGYATQKCELPEEVNTAKLRLYYPAAEK